MNLDQIKTKKIQWLHFKKPGEQEINYLRENFDFHPLDLEDCLNRVQRPEINEYHHYIFFVLTFPSYNRKTRIIESSEFNFFVGPNYLITMSDGLVPTLNNFFAEVKNTEALLDKYLNVPHPIFLLYEILNRLQNYTYPMLDHVSRDIENIEEQIFHGKEKLVVKEILHIKRNIVKMRKIMQAHKNIVKKLISTNNKSFMPDNTHIYFDNILDRAKDIWDILETQKENINAFQETNESLIYFKLNEVMKTLTIVSVTFFCATLIATIFAMEAHNKPIIGMANDFYVMLGIIAGSVLACLAFFRKKGWF